MSDLGPAPRRMDGFTRPGAAPVRPVTAPAVRPQPLQPQPLQPQPTQPRAGERPMPVVAPALVAAPEPALVTPGPAAKPAIDRSAGRPGGKKRGGWWVALQFIVGLLVIVAVATAVVVLYIRYYQ